MDIINQENADEYAQWFKCLGDGTRIRILNFIASASEPLTVGEIVKKVGKSQSTVSHHLQLLADGRFVILETEGVRTIVSVNKKCMTALPKAAAVIMASHDASSEDNQ